MNNEPELPERTKLEQEAGRKQAAQNAAALERAIKTREEEAAAVLAKKNGDKAAADAAVAEAVERKGKDRGRSQV